MRFDLSDEEWAAIEPLSPVAKHGPARVDDRRVLNGIFLYLAHWRAMAGLAGALSPENDGV